MWMCECWLFQAVALMETRGDSLQLGLRHRLQVLGATMARLQRILGNLTERVPAA